MSNLIFDLGGVILNLDYQLTVDAFKKMIPDLDESTFYGKEKQLEFFSLYETGRIKTDEFIERFNHHYHSEICKSDFTEAWNAMLLDLPISRLHYLIDLKQSGNRLFLLSNINELHEAAVGDLSSYFEKVYYSHRVGLRKPDPEIFRLVLSENKLDLQESCFIDDSEQHIRGARSVGLSALHLPSHISNDSLEQMSAGRLLERASKT
jgi:glucose-1-phosphatase